MSYINLIGSNDVLTAIRTEKAQVKRQINDSEKQLRKRYNKLKALASPLTYITGLMPADWFGSLSGMGGLGGLFGKGMLITQGVKMGMKLAEYVSGVVAKWKK